MIQYEDSMKTSYRFDKNIYESDVNWKKLEKLYNQYYLKIKDKPINNIPKKIHQIWLGGEIPKIYDIIRKTWEKCHPDWEYKLWTDKDIDSLNIINKKQYDNATNFGTKSDILRYEILYQFGGVYVDTDFECIKKFDDLLYLDFFSSVAYNEKIEMYNGLIASSQHNNIIFSCIKNMGIIKDGNWKDMFNSTGPYYFTKNVLNNIDSITNSVIFPITFFYPLPNNISAEDKLVVKKYLKPESYAIHQWHVSWGSKKITTITIQDE